MWKAMLKKLLANAICAVAFVVYAFVTVYAWAAVTKFVRVSQIVLIILLFVAWGAALWVLAKITER